MIDRRVKTHQADINQNNKGYSEKGRRKNCSWHQYEWSGSEQNIKDNGTNLKGKQKGIKMKRMLYKQGIQR